MTEPIKPDLTLQQTGPVVVWTAKTHKGEEFLAKNYTDYTEIIRKVSAIIESRLIHDVLNKAKEEGLKVEDIT